VQLLAVCTSFVDNVTISSSRVLESGHVASYSITCSDCILIRVGRTAVVCLHEDFLRLGSFELDALAVSAWNRVILCKIPVLSERMRNHDHSAQTVFGMICAGCKNLLYCSFQIWGETLRCVRSFNWPHELCVGAKAPASVHSCAFYIMHSGAVATSRIND
jgi:hypothetical protein